MSELVLEQLVSEEPNVSVGSMHQTVDTYDVGTQVLYGSGKPIVYDLPMTGVQMHLHENNKGILGGRAYSYDRQSWAPLNAYEGAMADHYAKQLGINRK